MVVQQYERHKVTEERWPSRDRRKPVSPGAEGEKVKEVQNESVNYEHGI